jgi:MscS family membrane protein
MKNQDDPRTTSLRRWAVLSVLVILLAGTATLGHAQGPAPETAEDARGPNAGETVGPESPRGAVEAYLNAHRKGRHDEAARYLDLRNLDPSDGPSLARKLGVVLDQKLWFDFEKLSTNPMGDPSDGLPSDVERVGVISMEDGELEVLMERTATDSREARWRFAASTVDRIPDLYDRFGYGIVGELLPEPFFRIRFLEIRLWQWLGLLAAVLLAAAASWIATWILYRVLRSIVSRTATRIDDELVDITARPFRLVIGAGFFYLGVIALRLVAPARDLLGGLVQALVIVGVTWLLLRIVDGFRDHVRRHLEETGRTGVVAVIPLGVKTVKAFVVLLAVITMLQHLGVNVTGIIAGLGVGGIALALAAQKTIENLFGGVTLIADQPVRVGNFCRFGDKVGTVEDVGLRSTRVRTLDRTVISIPNAEFSQTQIENFGPRDRIRLFCMLGLRYETTPDQMRHVITGLRRLLIAHPKVTPEPARVRLVGFGAYSLDLEVFAYIATSDWNEFLAVREDIFLRMMEIIAESGTGFAFPSNTTYLSRDGGLDAERSRQAEEEVRAWRDGSKLPFPGLDSETVAGLEDTLDYPPLGSAVAESGT